MQYRARWFSTVSNVLHVSKLPAYLIHMSLATQQSPEFNTYNRTRIYCTAKVHRSSPTRHDFGTTQFVRCRVEDHRQSVAMTKLRHRCIRVHPSMPHISYYRGRFVPNVLFYVLHPLQITTVSRNAFETCSHLEASQTLSHSLLFPNAPNVAFLSPQNGRRQRKKVFE